MRTILVLVATAIANASLPQYTINLDEPPEIRYRVPVDIHRDYIIGELTALNREFDRIVDDKKVKILNHFLDPEHGVHNMDEEFVAEARGIANQVKHPEVTLASIMKLNLMYELSYPTFCSGVLAAMPNGTVVHGRNMDYFLGQFHLEPGIVQFLYTRGGKPLFHKIDTVGGIGVHSGLRLDGGWSTEQNTRTKGGNIMDNLYKNYEAAKQGALGNSYALRRIIERAPDYETAVAMIRTTKFMAPNYFVIAGSKPYQGGIISMDRHGTHAKSQQDSKIEELGKNGQPWFLVQTNDERKQLPKDNRRYFAQFETQYMGRSTVSLNSVLRIMQTPPLFTPLTLMTYATVPALNMHQVEVHTMGESHKYTPQFMHGIKSGFLKTLWLVAMKQIPAHLKGAPLVGSLKQPNSFLAKRLPSFDEQLAKQLAAFKPHIQPAA